MVNDGKKRVNYCKMESWKNVKECKMLNDVKMLNWQSDDLSQNACAHVGSVHLSTFSHTL